MNNSLRESYIDNPPFLLGNSVRQKTYALFRQVKAILKTVLMTVYTHSMFVHR